MMTPTPKQQRVLAITRMIGAVAATLVLGYAGASQLLTGAKLEGSVLWLCGLTFVALAYALHSLGQLERVLRAQAAGRADSQNAK